MNKRTKQIIVRLSMLQPITPIELLHKHPDIKADDLVSLKDNGLVIENDRGLFVSKKGISAFSGKG